MDLHHELWVRACTAARPPHPAPPAHAAGPARAVGPAAARAAALCWRWMKQKASPQTIPTATGLRLVLCKLGAVHEQHVAQLPFQPHSPPPPRSPICHPPVMPFAPCSTLAPRITHPTLVVLIFNAAARTAHLQRVPGRQALHRLLLLPLLRAALAARPAPVRAAALRRRAVPPSDEVHQAAQLGRDLELRRQRGLQEGARATGCRLPLGTACF